MLLSNIDPASRLLDGANEREREAGHEQDGEVRLGAGVWIVSAS